MFNIKGYKKEDLAIVATELGQVVNPEHKVIDIKNLIENSEAFKQDENFVKELLLSTIDQRKESERRQIESAKEKANLDLELEKRRIESVKEKANSDLELELEKTRLELAKTQLEMAKFQAENRNPIGRSLPVSEIRDEQSLESLIKSVRTLTIPLPHKLEAWNLFFNSLEKAFEIKNVPDEMKVEILLNLMGEKAANLLLYVKTEDMKNYEKVKSIVLREFQPTPEICLETFRKAKRFSQENHIQFASRLRATWDYYCQLRKVTDFETLNELIVSDQLMHTLDFETKTHVNIRQGEMWFKPVELARECDIFFSSKGKSLTDTVDKQSKFRNPGAGNNFNMKYIPPPLRYNNAINKPHSKECYVCNQSDHLARSCPLRVKNKSEGSQIVTKKEYEKTKRTDKLAAKVEAHYFQNEIIPVSELQYINVLIGDQEIPALIDSGAEIAILNSKYAPCLEYEGCGKIDLVSAFGEKVNAEVRRIPICLKSEYPNYIQNKIDVLIAVTEKLKVPCIIPPTIYELLTSANYCTSENGNTQYQNKTDTSAGEEIDVEIKNNESSHDAFHTSLIETKNSVIDESSENETGITPSEEAQSSEAYKLMNEQQNCETLKCVRDELKTNKGNFLIIDNLIYHKDKVLGENVTQLVLPKNRREQVLKLAHESIFANHMGMRKTKERIRYSFYWPGMAKEIKEFCKTCEACQLRSPERRKDKIPITPVTRPNFPFEVVNVDIIGPIDPPSARRHKYVLCLIDQHSRWPEAIPLRSLTAKGTCDALLEIFMRTGIPRIIASDQGSNFISKLTQEFNARLGTQPRFSTPGYPASNGLIERYNKVLKQMLHHVIRSDPKNWDKHLPYLLFAYREVPNCTTGVSPFRLMYGREARGPLSVLKSSWSGEIPVPVNIGQSATDYLQELKISLETAVEQASLMAEDKQSAYAEYFNRRSSRKEFQIGEQVYLLIPDSNNKIYARWTGPAEIIARCNPHSYKVKLLDGKVRHVHANKIRKFHPRVQTIGVIFENEEEMGEIHSTPGTHDSEEKLHLENIDLNHLDGCKRKEIVDLLRKYQSLFSSKLQVAKVGEHKIRLTGADRKKPYIYRIPEALKPQVDQQIEELLELGLIEESDAEIAHPVVCVMKKDGSIRLCVDYRSLNAVTKPDDFPMENATELMYNIGKANVITTIDLLKGYWAIPMEKESQDFTSFKTHRAQYRFKVLPFGLKNSAATFQRVMNRVLSDCKEFARAYIDDIAVFSDDWDTHLEHLNVVFSKLKELGFTVNIKKCSFAKPQIKYLGHIIGSGRHQTDPEKIEAIQNLARPDTKKKLKSLLGLCNYYREYIPRYAETVYPLTELTKKKSPEQLPWTEVHETSFTAVKQFLADAPSLHTPIIGEDFIVQCDASSIGIGACLSQRRNDMLFPISYASQKLTKSQQAWATIEREAYAVIWSLKKFEPIIFGSKVQLITDHNPLTFITKNAPQSSKLQRWALALQKYNITVSHCPGSKLANADALSRLLTV